MGISIDTLKSEIHRAYRVLGPEKGYSQNVTDIKSWFCNRFINHEEYNFLRQYNRDMYPEF